MMEKYVSNETLAILTLGVIACIAYAAGDQETAKNIAIGLVGFIGGAKLSNK